jgi:hypothetical protein
MCSEARIYLFRKKKGVAHDRTYEVRSGNKVQKKKKKEIGIWDVEYVILLRVRG